MKKLLSIFTISLVFLTSSLNTNLVINSFSLISKFKEKLRNELSTNNDYLNSLLYTNNNSNWLESKSSNNFERKNYNSVFLKSLTYDHAKLKLTSTLTNLIKYDFKHHVSKTDTYLDKIDYLKMHSIVSKNKQETLIGNNLVFLNHFFNDQSLSFNPNGHIVSRESLLATNNVSTKVQSVFSFKNLKSNPLLRLKANSNGTKANVNISWSGIHFTTDHKVLTNHVLNMLNGSASYINGVTKITQLKKPSWYLKTNDASNGYFWDSWSDEQVLEYILDDETAMQGVDEDINIWAAENDVVEPLFQKLIASFRKRVADAVTNYLEGNEEADIDAYYNMAYKGLIRFCKQTLGYDMKAGKMPFDDPFDETPSTSTQLDSGVETSFAKYARYITASEEETTTDATSVASEVLGVDAEAAEAAATTAGVPILRWIIAIIVAIVTVTITVVVTLALKAVNHWTIKTGKIHPQGPWTLKQIWFNTKTRLFHQLTSNQIQFVGHFFKPWIGKIKSQIRAVKPVTVFPSYVSHKTTISTNLHHTYNLITGTNSNFNLIINPTTLKQVVASSYLPNPQYSVKQVLALNKLNYNNLNLSNDTWINLIQQIKHPYVNSNYAAILNYKNQKLTYSNIKANAKTNFYYSRSNYLQEMLSGDKNIQDLLANHQQLFAILNDLANVKNQWNDVINAKDHKVVVVGIKNSNYYNPQHYENYVTWYYYYFLKKKIWIDSNTNDATNIAFLTRIFTKLRLKKTNLNLKKILGWENNNGILDFSSREF